MEIFQQINEEGKNFVAVFQSNRVRLFVTRWTVACQAPLPFTVSWDLIKFMYNELLILSISFSATPFSVCLQSFPASGSFPISQLFE